MAAKITGAIGAIVAFKKVLDFSVLAKNAARDAEDFSNKFNVVFSSITQKANNTADNLAESFGLAGSTSRKLLGDVGDLGLVLGCLRISL